MNQIVPKPAARTAITVASTIVAPAEIAGAGDHAARRFLEFFAATTRNKNTRMAYYQAACSFFSWLEQRGVTELVDIELLHVDEPIEQHAHAARYCLTVGLAATSCDTTTIVSLRDRALIGVMTYAFTRIGAVVAMRVEDYYPNGKRW